MPTIIDPKIRAQETLAADVALADKLLEVEIGPPSKMLTREWKLTQDERQRSTIELHLSDSTGSVRGVFAPDELRDTYHMQRPIHSLWGDLLQIRAHKQTQRLNELVSQLEAE
jgi:hypothetical protein